MDAEYFVRLVGLLLIGRRLSYLREKGTSVYMLSLAVFDPLVSLCVLCLEWKSPLTVAGRLVSSRKR